MKVEGVLWPPVACARYGPLLSKLVRSYARQQGVPVGDEVAALLADMEDVGRKHRADSAAGTNGIGSAEPSVMVVDVGRSIPTELAAERLGVSSGYVRRLARTRRLPGRRAPGGGWEFDPLDVDDYLKGTA